MRKIFWIDLASEGDASFYSDAWYEVLGEKHNYFVNRNRNYRHRLFFYGRFKNPSRLLSKILFTIEIYFLFSMLLIYPSSNRIYLINIYQPFRFYNFLIKYLKKRGEFCVVILHDIVEFKNIGYPPLLLSSNAKIVRNADKVVLHGGKDQFKTIYGETKILTEVVFPIRKRYSETSIYDKLPVTKNYILFIGGYREEKGVENLLHLNYDDLDNYLLVIASKLPLDLSKMIRKNLADRVVLLEDYLTDRVFSSLIVRASYGICPYISGTNSGVYSSFLANNIPTITSDIPLFREIFVLEDLVVSIPETYSEVIGNLPNVNTTSYMFYKTQIASFVQKRDTVFKYDVDNLVAKLLE